MAVRDRKGEMENGNVKDVSIGRGMRIWYADMV